MASELEDQEIQVETEIEAEVEDVRFVPTGSQTKDKAIKALFVDCPTLIKDINKQNKWQDLCNAVNPVAFAEIFAIKHCGIEVPETEVQDILKAVKRIMISGHLSIIKAYNKNQLKEHILRLNNQFHFQAKADVELEPTSSSEPDSALVAHVTDVPIVASVAELPVTQNSTAPKTEPLSTAISLKENTLTNVDGTTYVFGKRGRRPLWVTQWMEQNPLLSPVA